MKFRLALANFLQAFPFCLVLIHGLFLRSGQHNEYQLAIVFSMGLYSALQIGGIWFISWIPRKIITEPFFWNFLRIAGGFIYLIDNSISIIIGTGLLGLAQALFYRFSRQMIGNYWKNKPSEMDHVYTIMALSLNISFLVLPVAGSELGKHFSTTILMSISVIFSIIGVALIERDKQFWQEIDPINIKETSQIIEKINDKLIVNPNLKSIFTDIFFLGSFVIPYGIMMALIPLKTKSEELGIEVNGQLFSLNAFIVICILFFKTTFLKERFISLDLTKNLKLLSVTAWLLAIFSGLASIKWFVVSFTVWSLLEALQLPIIEIHLFSKRSYSSKWIERILVVDAIGSIIAPLIASILISMKRGLF